MLSTSLFSNIPAISVNLNGVIKLFQIMLNLITIGPDKIPTRLLKECAKGVAPSLVCYIKRLLNKTLFLLNGIIHL